jgi:hypothetical protein
MPDVLVASVTAVFTPVETDAAGPAEIAEALLEREHVMTVRVGPHGGPSVYRVDVPGDGSHENAAAEASAVARAVAEDLGLSVDIVSVGLLTDETREEIFRAGTRIDEPVWGGRRSA